MQKRIWIDLDNSPHVPLFAPIIEQLRERDYIVIVTARKAFQVCELADAIHLDYKPIGRHFGKNKLLKIAGLAVRATQLVPTIIKERPNVAISHGSRAQLLAATLAGVPTILLMDYEHVRGLIGARPSWVMVAEPIATEAIPIARERVLHYPGIKEDVYVPRFNPDPSIRKFLGLEEGNIIVTIRPPAQEAHYHNPESDRMFVAVVERLRDQPNTRMVMLPRNTHQDQLVRSRWSELFENRRIIVPKCAVDGLNLMWHSDLVVSGGGTMNREAAALRIPVYSVFRGRIGAVDRYLVAKGRLTLLETIDDVKTKMVVTQRSAVPSPGSGSTETLEAIVNQIATIANSCDAISRKASKRADYDRVPGGHYDDSKIRGPR